ncbi:FkbM family methyltransferase [Dyella sp. M7H15-1]|uniref:FkbM family methyltransferase n=1 Tax=Dyella sp. M7H15-1 TaxID=2501295 RepID=UPI001004ED77|nr:FkbM family methyltransferase [Dyella sp. M7H15-1]QAU24993.1 FkbM family methyltransferase [Dyella sp. M7H15-1]
MNKIYRNQVDLRSALFSLAKREDAYQDKGDAMGDSSPGTPFSEGLGQMQNTSVGFKRRIKWLLRKPAAAVYRFLKPFIRPLAYRTRTFFHDGIHQHTSRLSAELHVKLDQEMWHLMTFKEELQRLRAEVQADQSKTSATVIQELQFMRELLEEDLHDTYAKVERALASIESSLSTKLDRTEAYAYVGARRFAVNCGNGDVLVRTDIGYIMCQGSTDPAVLSMLIESGDVERGTRLLIQRLLKPGDLFIDVGANLGLHTMAAAHAMQGKGKIIAFEPFPDTARLLRLSVLINGFADMVEIHQTAVSTGSGKRSLYLGQVSGHHSLFPHGTGLGNEQRHVEVSLSSIDDIVGEDEPVALVKIDVEGAELEVLETAKSTIRRNPGIAIIAEFGPSHLQVVGHDAADWLASFTSLGMDWRAINEDTGALELYSFEQLKSVHSVNLLFAKTGSSVFSI